MATYTSAATGLWSAGATWVGGVKPPSGAGHKIVIAAGHVVTYDEAAGVYGDDTSSITASSNAIAVTGTLKASRSVSTSLTCRGTLALATNGALDWGTVSDPIPSGVVAQLLTNDSAALASGKHGLLAWRQSNNAINFVGVQRTRNTSLSSATGANATSISVAASVGWAVGDTLVIAPDTDDATRAQTTTISGGSAPNWTISPAITNARASGCFVGNLTSNVVIRPVNASFPGVVAVYTSDSDTTSQILFQDVELRDMGWQAGWVGGSQSRPNTWGLGFAGAVCPPMVARRVAVHGPGNVANQAFGVGYGARNDHVLDDCAVYLIAAAANALNLGDGSVSQPSGLIVYRAARGVVAAYEAGAGSALMTNCRMWTTSSVLVPAQASKFVFEGGELRTLAGSAVGKQWGVAQVNNAYVSANRLTSIGAPSTSSRLDFNSCTYSSGTLTGSLTTGFAPTKSDFTLLSRVNGVESDNRVMTYWHTTVTDDTTRRRSTFSVRAKPNVANQAIFYTFTVPAIAGVAQTIKGSLRFDSTYGTATPPSIAFVGQGVSASFTSPAVADTWNDFTLSFTPTTTGDINVTMTIQSSSTSGLAWLDGVYHFPMTQSVRHFGYQWLPQASQLVDSRVTLTEAASLALPVSINHGTSTITVSGPVSNSDVWHACIADLCQTANIGRALHISSANGAVFTTSYTVAFSGTGAISGVYTDAAGVHVQIAAPALISGSRVQLYNVTDSAQLFNGVLSADGLVFDATWTANKTVRLRAEHDSKLPLQTVGVLTSSGLSFLDVQAEDSVYLSNGIDGSTCTEFAADGANVQIDIDDPDGVTSVQRLYAWMQWYQTTSAGIASAFFGAVSAIDAASYSIDQALVDIKLDNIGSTPVRVVGGYLSRKDGSTIIAAASGSIQMDPGKAYVAGMSAPIVLNPGERLVTTSAGNLYAR